MYAAGVRQNPVGKLPAGTGEFTYEIELVVALRAVQTSSASQSEAGSHLLPSSGKGQIPM